MTMNETCLECGFCTLGKVPNPDICDIDGNVIGNVFDHCCEFFEDAFDVEKEGYKTALTRKHAEREERSKR